VARTYCQESIGEPNTADQRLCAFKIEIVRREIQFKCLVKFVAESQANKRILIRRIILGNSGDSRLAVVKIVAKPSLCRKSVAERQGSNQRYREAVDLRRNRNTSTFHIDSVVKRPEIYIRCLHGEVLVEAIAAENP
jgi:hypothetical protein